MEREEADKLLHDKVEAGETVSPVLPEGIKNYLIDIDGTITDDVPNEEPERMGTCLPFPDALETCNRWYDESYDLFLPPELKTIEVTQNWLNKHGLNFIVY